MGKMESGEMSQNDFHVLIDADVFVGWMFTEDAHHQKAKLALQQARAEYLTPVTTNYVVGEAATVLSKLADQSLAKDFLKVIDSIIQTRLADFPAVEPAIKQGIKVKSQFVLPVILKVTE